MIPACHTCNEIENKGDMDPIVYPTYKMKLLNPYEFYDRVVTFSYEYNGMGENDKRNFKIESEAADFNYEEGYLEKLKLRSFYANQRLEVKEIYRKFTTCSKSFEKFLYNMGVKKPFLQNLEKDSWI